MSFVSRAELQCDDLASICDLQFLQQCRRRQRSCASRMCSLRPSLCPYRPMATTTFSLSPYPPKPLKTQLSPVQLLLQTPQWPCRSTKKVARGSLLRLQTTQLPSASNPAKSP